MVDPRVMRQRWRGTRGRLEVWYATFTCPTSGDGFWLHHELLAPLEGDAVEHGWAAVFGAGRAPVVERYGPSPAREGGGAAPPDGRLAGEAGALRWDLTYVDDSKTLYTFPRWSWEREILPGAQLVAAPSAIFDGSFSAGDDERRLTGARGAVAHIWGHGNAARWGWLHADLGGGDVLEIVAASSRKRLFSPLGVVPLVRLRLDGADWPRRPLLTALRATFVETSARAWSVTACAGGRRLTARVALPDVETVSLVYQNPDDTTVTCTNSERADAEILLERRRGGGFCEERSWRLLGSAHAERGG